MNILSQVKNEHSKAMCNRVVGYVGNDPGRFKELVEVFLKGPYRVTQRAAWPLSCAVETHPELIVPHLQRILKNLDKPGIHDSVKRNTVRLMQYIEIPKSLHGTVANLCFGFVQDSGEPIAVRCFSMTVLDNITKGQPDLRKELKIILEDLLPYATAGISVRAKKILKKIDHPLPLPSRRGERGR